MLNFSRPCSRLPFQRFYSTKSKVQLVSELRKVTNAPIMKARQALDEAGGDLDAALQWLEKDLQASGAAKAEKIKDRTATEGLISISVLDGGLGSRIGKGLGPVKAAIIELNCESDFVSRTNEFSRLAADIVHSVAQFSSSGTTESPFASVDVASLLQSPLGTGTVRSSITDLIARIGENITLRRAALLAPPEATSSVLRAASYMHRSTPEFPNQGRVGALALISMGSPRFPDLFKDSSFVTDIEKLERALCRQTAGFMTRSVRRNAEGVEDPETVLYEQQFMMLGGEKAGLPVRQVLDDWEKQWGLDEFEVASFLRWEVGESHATQEK